jgi:hypothetical protein
MINTQHAHIYRIHTLHFIFGEIFFLKILSIQPLNDMSNQRHGEAGDVDIADMRGRNFSPVRKGNLEWVTCRVFFFDGCSFHDKNLCSPGVCNGHLRWRRHCVLGKCNGIGWRYHVAGGHV